METKSILLAAGISFFGSIIEPEYKPIENKSYNSELRNKGQVYLDSLKQENNRLIDSIQYGKNIHR